MPSEPMQHDETVGNLGRRLVFLTGLEQGRIGGLRLQLCEAESKGSEVGVRTKGRQELNL